MSHLTEALRQKTKKGPSRHANMRKGEAPDYDCGSRLINIYESIRPAVGVDEGVAHTSGQGTSEGAFMDTIKLLPHGRAGSTCTLADINCCLSGGH